MCIYICTPAHTHDTSLDLCRRERERGRVSRACERLELLNRYRVSYFFIHLPMNILYYTKKKNTNETSSIKKGGLHVTGNLHHPIKGKLLNVRLQSQIVVLWQYIWRQQFSLRHGCSGDTPTRRQAFVFSANCKQRVMTVDRAEHVFLRQEVRIICRYTACVCIICIYN